MKTEDELQLQAYLDGELSAGEAMQFERRLADSAELAAGLAELRAMRQRLREQASYHAAPDALRAQLRGRLRSQSRRQADAGAGTLARGAGARRAWPAWPGSRAWDAVPRLAPWASGLAGLAAGVLIAFALGLARPGETLFGAPQPQFSEMLDGHLRAALDTHWVDVASSDRHTVKPWLSAHLGFSPNVPDLADQGYELLGGRLDVLSSQPVATLVYRRRQHMISVFVWPERPGAPQQAPRGGGEQRGYHMVRWQVSGMAYCSVSDLNPQELEDFSRLLAAAQ